jgi:hypothetical protein
MKMGSIKGGRGLGRLVVLKYMKEAWFRGLRFLGELECRSNERHQNPLIRVVIWEEVGEAFEVPAN